jgi:hypothetical protein
VKQAGAVRATAMSLSILFESRFPMVPTSDIAKMKMKTVKINKKTQNKIPRAVPPSR